MQYSTKEDKYEEEIKLLGEKLKEEGRRNVPHQTQGKKKNHRWLIRVQNGWTKGGDVELPGEEMHVMAKARIWSYPG